MGLGDLFTSWDSSGNVMFYNCVFTKDVGPFKKGDKVENIYIDVYESKLYVYNDGKETRLSFTLNVAPIEDE